MSELITEMRRRLQLAIDADGGNRVEQLEDTRFSFGDQWPAAIKMARQLEGRPALTINKTDTFVRSVVNNMRAQRPRGRVHPVSDGACVKKANVIEGLIRHIEVNSNADLAYDTAGEAQVRAGEGYWRVCSRYVSNDSFDQELYIDRIRNAFTVYMDPSATMPDGSDAEWCVITSSMRKAEFRQKYPRAKVADVTDLGPGDDKALWASAEEVVVAEYYRFVDRPDVLWLLSDGSKVLKSRAPTEHDLLVQYNIRVVHSRPTTSRQLKWSLCSAVEELDVRNLPGKYIPVVRATGAEMIDGGKVRRFGMVRQLKDPARMYNYWRTQETEYVALAPLAPWLMAEGQDEGHEDEWQTANRKSYSRLIYKPVHDEQNNPLPEPKRLTPQAPPAASINAAMAASEDLKAVAGMFDPSLGAPGQETSGTMVRARQGQSDMSNYHFYDNLTRSIRHTYIILLDLIPHYYDTQRVIRILGIDGVPQTVTINEKQRDPETQAILQVLNDVTVGTYDVVMDTGPGYQTKRQENSDMLLGLLKTLPQVGQTAGDIVVRQMDFEAAGDVADRLAAANPLAMAEKELPKDLPDDVKAYIAHLMGANQQLQRAVQQAEMEKKYRVDVETARQQGKLASDQLWATHETEQERMRQEAENRRTLAREHGQNVRAEIAAEAKIHDTNTRAAESWREAQLDAHTDLELGRDRGPNNEFHREHA